MTAETGASCPPVSNIGFRGRTGTLGGEESAPRSPRPAQNDYAEPEPAATW
jgi:hypothetical protein